MSNWSPQDWMVLIGGSFIALSTFIGAVLSAVAAFKANLAKLKGEDNELKIHAAASKAEVIEAKLDKNTELTVEGTEAAASNALEARNAAIESSNKTEDIARQLNGKLDDRIKAHTDPIMELLEKHIADDDSNMKDLRATLQKINEKIPESKH